MTIPKSGATKPTGDVRQVILRVLIAMTVACIVLALAPTGRGNGVVMADYDTVGGGDNGGGGPSGGGGDGGDL